MYVSIYMYILPRGESFEREAERAKEKERKRDTDIQWRHHGKRVLSHYVGSRCGTCSTAYAKTWEASKLPAWARAHIRNPIGWHTQYIYICTYVYVYVYYISLIFLHTQKWSVIFKVCQILSSSKYDNVLYFIIFVYKKWYAILLCVFYLLLCMCVCVCYWNIKGRFYFEGWKYLLDVDELNYKMNEIIFFLWSNFFCFFFLSIWKIVFLSD